MVVNCCLGKTRHYAYIEFSEPDIGKIIAESLDGVIFGGRILKSAIR